MLVAESDSLHFVFNFIFILLSSLITCCYLSSSSTHHLCYHSSQCVEIVTASICHYLSDPKSRSVYATKEIASIIIGVISCNPPVRSVLHHYHIICEAVLQSYFMTCKIAAPEKIEVKRGLINSWKIPNCVSVSIFLHQMF